MLGQGMCLPALHTSQAASINVPVVVSLTSLCIAPKRGFITDNAAPVIDLETHANIGGKLGMHLCPPGDKNPLATSLVNGQLNQYQMAVSADGDNVSWKPTGMTKCPYRDLDLTRHEGEPSFHTFFEGKIAAAKSGEGSNRDVSSGLYEGPVRPEDVSSTIFEA